MQLERFSLLDQGLDQKAMRLAIPSSLPGLRSVEGAALELAEPRVAVPVALVHGPGDVVVRVRHDDLQADQGPPAAPSNMFGGNQEGRVVSPATERWGHPQVHDLGGAELPGVRRRFARAGPMHEDPTDRLIALPGDQIGALVALLEAP